MSQQNDDAPDFDDEFEDDEELSGGEGWVLDILNTSPRKSAQKNDVFRRTATLVLVDALDEMGCLPYPRSEMEGLLFIVDCLWPAVSQSETPYPLHGIILKMAGGPHQSDWLWDLDRSVGMGLLNVVAYEEVAENYTYTLTEEGIKFVEKVEMVLPELRRFRDLVKTVVPLFSSQSHENQLKLLENDRTYASGNNALESLIDYGQWEKGNPSAQHIQELATYLRNVEDPINAADQYLRGLVGNMDKDIQSQTIISSET